MDPITHTLAGAALSRAGLHRATPLATATLVFAANAPDIDVLAYRAGPYAALAFRRGWTHGPLALLLLPFAVAGMVLLWDRFVRRRRDRTLRPARAGPLCLLAFLGVVSHPLLDWLNTYGVRFLAPFDTRWYYGDAVFIIDPWLWLALGGSLFIAGRRSSGRLAGWVVFAAVTSALVLLVPMVPPGAKVLWIVVLLGLALLRRRPEPARPERVVRAALAGVGVYIAAMIVSSAAAERTTRAVSLRAGFEPVSVLFQPGPSDPFRGSVVVETAEAYHVGPFSWFGRPRVMLSQVIARGDWKHPGVVEAMQRPEVRDYLVWSRYPFVRVVEGEGGNASVWVGDARYADIPSAGGTLSGVRVEVDGS